MATRYWVPAGGTSTGTWDSTTTTNWSTTSGGAGGASAPTSSDDVVFDANSDNGTSFTVTHSTSAACLGLTISNLDFPMTLTGTTAISINGSISWPSSNFTKLGTGAMNINGSSTRTIDTAGVNIPGGFTVNAAGATITLAGNLQLGLGRTILFTAGTRFNFAGYNVTCGSLSSTGSSTRTLNLGSGTITCTDASNACNFTGATNLTLIASSATIIMTASTGKTFGGNGYTYGTLKNGGAGALTISGSNTFTDLSNTVQPCTINLTAGTTQTLSNLSLSGTSGSLVTLQSATASSTATITKSSGTVTVNYMTITDITASGGATWNAFNSSGTRTSGWNFLTAYAMTASPGTFSISGKAVTLAFNRALNAETGSYVISGNAVDLIKYDAPTIYILSAETGVFNITGQDVGLIKNAARYYLDAQTGAFNITGQPANLVYAAGPNHYVLNANGYAMNITGQDANLFVSSLRNRRIVVFT